MPSFAYLFERFPSFTQTFCYREVTEMVRRGMAPAVYSIRVPDDVPADCPPEIAALVHYLPKDVTVISDVKQARTEGRLDLTAEEVIMGWGNCSDKLRAYTAAWLGPVLMQQKIRHVHAHFAGLAARTAYWLKKFFGFHYSFTGHANDIFCQTDFPVTIADLVREAAFVVTETDYSRADLARRFPEYAAKIHRVYNGIEVAAFPEPRPAEGKPRILSVGRHIEKKGFADLIEACSLLRNRGLEFECLIVGGGPLEETLRAQVTRSGLDGIVTLCGPQPQEEVRAMMAGASLFVLACATEASGGMDNFPTVIVEAMASSLPVVSTRLAGVPEMVCEGVTGLLAEEKNPASLADAMEAILLDPESGRQMGTQGRLLSTERFSTAASVGELQRLLIRHGNTTLPMEAFRQEPSLALTRCGRPFRHRFPRPRRSLPKSK